MKEESKQRVRRTQRDYTMGFKLSVVAQVEEGEMTYKQAQALYGIQGRSTVLVWLRKHGTLDWSKPMVHFRKSPTAKETPAQKIKRLEKELEEERIKTALLDKMIEISDRELGTSIRKKPYPRAARSLQRERQMSLSACCRQLGVSRQSVYLAEKRHDAREAKLQEAKAMVLKVRARMPRLGTRKLYFLLKDEFAAKGIKVGRDALFSLLRREHLLIARKKNYTKTTNSKHWLKKHPNLLKEVHPGYPEQVFVSDITYVKTREQTCYLTLVTDAFSRKIMGYNVSKDLGAESTVKALDAAIGNKQRTVNTIHHSDRGLQYASLIYQEKLKESGMVPSMTDGYDCYQNALAERMNGILKQEFMIATCNSFVELDTLVKESVEIYNSERPHLSLGMRTPSDVHESGCGASPAA
ncbi:MAG: IS3 family transposase [Candidatus Bathyarchaeota archaeon]|nr:IS3 family transposase [Candidatus Bathyarchaeota archaeon]